MTQEELDALPELESGFGVREIRPGVVAPVQPPQFVLFDPTYVLDVNGEEWAVGTLNGVRHKRRVR